MRQKQLEGKFQASDAGVDQGGGDVRRGWILDIFRR